MRKTDPFRNAEIAKRYVSGKYTTEQLAASFGLKPRRVQQIAAEFGVVRSIAESNRLIAPLKRIHRVRRRGNV